MHDDWAAQRDERFPVSLGPAHLGTLTEFGSEVSHPRQQQVCLLPMATAAAKCCAGLDEDHIPVDVFRC